MILLFRNQIRHVSRRKTRYKQSTVRGLLVTCEPIQRGKPSPCGALWRRSLNVDFTQVARKLITLTYTSARYYKYPHVLV